MVLMKIFFEDWIFLDLNKELNEKDKKNLLIVIQNNFDKQEYLGKKNFIFKVIAELYQFYKKEINEMEILSDFNFRIKEQACEYLVFEAYAEIAENLDWIKKLWKPFENLIICYE